jgi:hypothetical protein
MKKLLLVLILAAFSYAANHQGGIQADSTIRIDSLATGRIGSEASDTQVQGVGIVDRILPDDTRGSRHQRFILRLESGQTLLVAHNIDLAPRVADLAAGDTVEFSGEYEWNEKGGVIHWTHNDPANQHAAGWLKHDGQVYR